MLHSISNLTALVLLTSTLAFATPIPELSQYLEDQINTFNTAVGGTEANSTPVELKGEALEQFYFMNFWLRIRPKVGFSVPGLVKVEIIPETEILWQREIPDRWDVYQP